MDLLKVQSGIPYLLIKTKHKIINVEVCKSGETFTFEEENEIDGSIF